MTGEQLCALLLLGVAMWLVFLGWGPVPVRVVVASVAVFVNLYVSKDR
jgi:hypothetical protein